MAGEIQNWKVMRLKPRTEKAMADLLAGCGVEHYLPLRQAVRKYASKTKRVELPLFPGYLFATFDDEQRGLFLPRQQYILKIITPFSTLRLLRQLVAVRWMLREIPDFNPKGELREGVLVRVVKGPMRDMRGWVARIQSKAKVVLYLDEIGQEIPVTMPGDFLEVEV
jgi:transcription antitermination factor NusG